MRLIWQAIRAVTVEMLGVGAVLFVLFSAAGWTVESAGVEPMQEADRAWKWLQSTTDQVTAAIKPNLTADQRQRFAAERLDYYGQLYGGATPTLHLPEVPADQSPSLPTNQLLGTL